MNIKEEQLPTEIQALWQGEVKLFEDIKNNVKKALDKYPDKDNTQKIMVMALTMRTSLNPMQLADCLAMALVEIYKLENKNN